MSRLFTVQTTPVAVAAQFGTADATNASLGGDVVEGGRSVVVLEKDSQRRAAIAEWGFPRARGLREHGDGPPRIGLVADLTNPMWEGVVVEPRYRCLIPLTHFANPAGEAGGKTRTWFAVEGEPLVAWAGFCRNTSEFAPVFAGMTMTANDAVMPFNDRMPVLLGRDEYARWLHGPIEDVIAFQFRPPLAAARMVVTHTDDRWRSGKVPEFGGAAQPALL